METLERFNLADRAQFLAGEQSHGQQQWLEIAMAVIREPKLLLLDEPTGGMSPEERRATGELLLPIKKNCTLIIVEHDLELVLERNPKPYRYRLSYKLRWRWYPSVGSLEPSAY